MSVEPPKPETKESAELQVYPKKSSEPDLSEEEVLDLFALAVSRQSFSGPLPPPEVLIRYKEAVADGPERIFAMAEKESAHRQGNESAVIAASIRNEQRGQWFAFIIVIFALSLGGLLSFHDKQLAGLTTMVTALATLVAVFIYGKIRQSRELARKREETTGSGTDPLNTEPRNKHPS